MKLKLLGTLTLYTVVELPTVFHGKIVNLIIFGRACLYVNPCIRFWGTIAQRKILVEPPNLAQVMPYTTLNFRENVQNLLKI